MYEFLGRLRSTISSEPVVDQAAPVPVERDPRVALHRCEMRMICNGLMYQVRVRDLSSGGLCGVTDAPVSRLDVVEVELELGTWVEAQVRWLRNSKLGFAFTAPLEPHLISRICNRFGTPHSRH